MNKTFIFVALLIMISQILSIKKKHMKQDKPQQGGDKKQSSPSHQSSHIHSESRHSRPSRQSRQSSASSSIGFLKGKYALVSTYL